MATEIKFGTSGWRAVVAEEFTLANIRRAVTGIAKYVASQPGSRRVLVGRDPRFLGEICAGLTIRGHVPEKDGVSPVC
jgi:phosphoglucomutase